MTRAARAPEAPTVFSSVIRFAATPAATRALGETDARARIARTAPAVSIRGGRASDVREIAKLIAAGQGDAFLLPRSEEDVRAAFGRFAVAVLPAPSSGRGSGRERVVGAASLEPYGPHLAEIRSLVVHGACRGLGIGNKLVRDLLRRARRRGVERVFALTTRLGFFERLGFVAVPLETLPEKVFRDCAHCPRRASCVETAFVWRARKGLAR
jgi:amino-acid N-acetyltransferase